MTAKIAFSVIVTNHDYGAFVGDAIASVKAQTWDDVECIVVDDGSTDGSRGLIEAIPGITALFGPNEGQARAAARGFAVARGDVIVFLDADDRLDPEACAEIAGAWTDDLLAVMARLRVERDGRQTGDTVPATRFRCDDALDLFLACGSFVSPPTSGNAFARRLVAEVFETGDGLTANAVDYWLCLSALLAGPTRALDHALGSYRLHGANISAFGARRSIRQIRREIVTAADAQRSAQRIALAHGRRFTPLPHVAGAYELKWNLLLRGDPTGDPELPEIPFPWAVRRAVAAFARLDGAPLVRRLANIVQVVALAVLPWGLRRRLALRLYRLRDDAI